MATVDSRKSQSRRSAISWRKSRLSGLTIRAPNAGGTRLGRSRSARTKVDRFSTCLSATAVIAQRTSFQRRPFWLQGLSLAKFRPDAHARNARSAMQTAQRIIIGLRFTSSATRPIVGRSRFFARRAISAGTISLRRAQIVY